jgi:salicylate hydroxylase
VRPWRSVEARFANGASAEVDVLVGADGIQSAVQRELFGEEGARYSECVAYRGLVPAKRVRHLDLDTTVQMWMGPGRHFVHYFVRARELVNFVAVVEKDWCTRESWIERGDPTEVRVAFQGWHRQVQGILEAAEEPMAWALHDRPPLGYWSAGRVTLLGDACHPMLPFMAQGAAQAIEDAATLATCLAQQSADTAAALRRYERLRIPRTSRLQAMSAQNKLRFHLPDGPARQDRDARMATGTTDWSSGGQLDLPPRRPRHRREHASCPGPKGQAALADSARRVLEGTRVGIAVMTPVSNQ